MAVCVQQGKMTGHHGTCSLSFLYESLVGVSGPRHRLVINALTVFHLSNSLAPLLLLRHILPTLPLHCQLGKWRGKASLG